MIALAFTILHVGDTKVQLTGWGIFWAIVVAGAARATLTIDRDGQ